MSRLVRLAGPCLCRPASCPSCPPPSAASRTAAPSAGPEDVLLGEVGVPDRQRGQRGELRHRDPVGPHRLDGHRAGIGRRETIVLSSDREAGRHPLHVVLERAGEGLVEVVQTEHYLSLGRGVAAEVGQMSVTAQLSDQPRRGGGGQVGGHHLGCASIEGEGRRHHPTVPQGHQLRLARPVLLDQQLHRVAPFGCRLPPLVLGQGQLNPRLLAASHPGRQAQVVLLGRALISATLRTRAERRRLGHLPG